MNRKPTETPTNQRKEKEMSTITRRLSTASLLASAALFAGMMSASAAPGEPISLSADDASWLASQGVEVSINSTAINLSGSGPAPTVVVWGTGVITEQDLFAGPATGSIIPAHDDYAWAHEIGGWGSLNLNADAHTSFRVGGAGGEDYTRIADRMNTLVAPEVYAGRDGIGHEVSTLSDCTASECGVWVSPVVLEQDAEGNDILRTTADARWIAVEQDGSAWEDSADITWDASTGRGTRVEGDFLEAYRAQSTGTLSAPWLAPSRVALPAPAVSTVNPDGTVTVGVSGGGVAARRGLVMLNLGYEGGEAVDPGTPAEPPVTPPVTPPVVPPVTPEPEATPTPEVTSPVLRFETGEFTADAEGMPLSNLLVFLGAGGAVLGAFALITRTRRPKKSAADRKN